MSDSDGRVVLENEVEAQLLDAELSALDIPHSMMSYHDFAFDGVFQMSKGWGHVEADVEFREQILSILDGIRHGQENLEDAANDADSDAENT